jgi:hypothetical protein
LNIKYITLKRTYRNIILHVIRIVISRIEITYFGQMSLVSSVKEAEVLDYKAGEVSSRRREGWVKYR